MMKKLLLCIFIIALFPISRCGKVTDIDIQYGINCLPTVRISFLAGVEIEEKDVID